MTALNTAGKTLSGQLSSIHCSLCLPTLIKSITGPTSQPGQAQPCPTSLHPDQLSAAVASHYHCWAPTLSQVTHRHGQSFVCPLHLWLPLSDPLENSPWGTSGPRPWSTSNPDGGHRARGPSETKSRLQNYKHVHWADGTGLANSSGVFPWPECRVTQAPQWGFLSTASPQPRQTLT